MRTEEIAKALKEPPKGPNTKQSTTSNEWQPRAIERQTQKSRSWRRRRSQPQHPPNPNSGESREARNRSTKIQKHLSDQPTPGGQRNQGRVVQDTTMPEIRKNLRTPPLSPGGPKKRVNSPNWAKRPQTFTKLPSADQTQTTNRWGCEMCRSHGSTVSCPTGWRPAQIATKL